ncbi:isochorismatase family protein [Lysobacter changpingensis]|uniref:isochorismatase family protein n=1 Tax=Lysobacter changpingensis TaxID=2792784 RepID=UPI001A90297D|nr:isochorismatase family cysteine hydrolase [Lysobacter changpingensis]
MKGHALLIIDMINALDFPEGEKLLATAKPAARRIASLKQRLKPRGVPVIYVNDNYGQWRSDFKQVVARCAAPDSLGAPLVTLLRPEEDDFFVLKPERSGFRDTPLRMLLGKLDAKTLILTGIALDACVLATASDANMHGFKLHVPSDCVASETPGRRTASLKLLRDSLQVDTRPSRAITLR